MGNSRTEVDSSRAMMHFTTRLLFTLRKLRIKSGRSLTAANVS